MKINDIPNPWWEDLKLPWLDGPAPKWHLNYHDGPLSGIVETDDGQLWFVSCPWLESRTIWCAWKLTAEEAAYEQAVHAAFREHVGVHTDYNPATWERSVGSTHPQGEWKKFYDDPRWKRPSTYLERDFDALCHSPF
jgi:hypothetical protein